MHALVERVGTAALTEVAQRQLNRSQERFEIGPEYEYRRLFLEEQNVFYEFLAALRGANRRFKKALKRHTLPLITLGSVSCSAAFLSHKLLYC